MGKKKESSSSKEKEDDNIEVSKQKSAMDESVLSEIANQKSPKQLKKGLSKKSSHLEENVEKNGNKYKRKKQESVSSSEESSEEEVSVNIRINSQYCDENESINELSDSVEYHNSHVNNLAVSGIQKKSKTEKEYSQNRVSESDQDTLESIEKRILGQSCSDVDFGTSTNGTLNILQNITLSPPKMRNPHDQFNKLYPNINQLVVELPTKFSNKHDYHLLRLPKNIDPQSMLNMDINIQEENKIICGDKKFIIKPTTKVPSPGLIVPKNIILNFMSNIVMEKYVKSKKHTKLECIEKKPISLPNDLKNRHPLFGSNFENKIELDEDIKRKLDAAISNTLQRERKSKKKKVKKEDQSQGEEVIFNLLNNLGEKSRTSGMPSEDNVSLSQDSKLGAKKVKTKKFLIDETLRNLKSELLSEYETDHGDASLKKKKKHKANRDTSIPEKPTIHNTVTSDIWSTGLSKKERRRMSIANSTMMMDILKQPKFDPDMSDIISTAKDIKEHSKKHKRKTNRDDAEHQLKKKVKREEIQ